MSSDRAARRRRLRCVAGLVDRAAAQVRYMRGAPREDSTGLAKVRVIYSNRCAFSSFCCHTSYLS
jgi:hypothetical protein